MEGVPYLEFYLEQCAAEDGLVPAKSPLFSPAIRYDVYTPNASNPETALESHPEVKETSDLSSVDLSFLPDEITQENRDQTVIRRQYEIEENRKTRSRQNNLLSPSKQDAEPGLNSSSLSNSCAGLQPGGSDAPPLVPIDPMTPVPSASESSGIVPQLQNIVSTVNLACKLDLKKIALHAKNAEYNPQRFAAVIMRIREPRTTALIFSSGKIVCTGAKSEEQSRLAARKYARVVQKLGFPARFLDFKIQNMVASCDVRFSIRLEGLVLAHQQFSSYEPELFPGLIYRMVKPQMVLLIFTSGKVVLTGDIQSPISEAPAMYLNIFYQTLSSTKKGAKERSEIYEAFENIYPILKGFRKP